MPVTIKLEKLHGSNNLFTDITHHIILVLPSQLIFSVLRAFQFPNSDIILIEFSVFVKDTLVRLH